jgi:putative FmdB family regulatory protein
MPMYAYACKDCGHAFDIQQSFSDDSLTVCPECGGGLRKKFNSVGVVFKGSGFYRNDSRATTTSTDAGSSSSVSASSSDSSGSATAGSAAAAPSGSSTGSTASATTGGSAAAS